MLQEALRMSLRGGALVSIILKFESDSQSTSLVDSDAPSDAEEVDETEDLPNRGRSSRPSSGNSDALELALAITLSLENGTPVE
jgi:hypothetical protein